MTEPTLRQVVIREAPVGVWEDAREWVTGLVREFDVIASAEDGGSVPKRLVAFVADAGERFGRFARGDELLDDAIAAGRGQVDVRMSLPDEARHAAVDLRNLLLQAEEYCRSGALLTLVPSADVRRFTYWYLDEIARQIGGAEPVRWSEAGSAE